MSVSENVPFWVDPMLAEVLPRGIGWEVDVAAGHPVLATRFYKWADGSFDHQPHCKDGEDCRLLPLRGEGGFVGGVEVHRAASGEREFLLRDLRDFGGGRVFKLPIADPRRFETLLVELTQPLELLPRSEFEGPSKGPALLLPVLRGGHRCEEDRAAGHPVLAARIRRCATGSLDRGEVWRVGGLVYDSHWLPMADGFSLLVRRWKRSNRGSVGNNFDDAEFRLFQFRSDEYPLVLKISKPHARALWRLLRELNQP